MARRCCLLFAVACLLFGKAALAQEEEAADSLMSYDLAEIVVRGSTEREASASTLQRVTLAGIAQADAATMDRVARLIPAAHVQTNSRGETLVYLRSAGERQVALFFDGALLNVPWDNRFDLALVPSGVVGGVSVAKGVPSVLYGTNVLGGAINLTSRTLGGPGRFTEATALLGQPGAAQAALTHLGRTQRWAYTLSAGFARRDGIALPTDADLPFNQRGDDLRTNTDQRLLNLFGQAGYTFPGGAQLGLALLHLDAEKGVAPEGHLDPARYRVRYWRYPDWRTTMLILNGAAPLGNGGTLLRGAAWGSHFSQTIDQFRSDRYDALAQQEHDDDYTAGARLTLQQPAGMGELRLALNALTSEHRQQERAFDGAARLPAPTQTFRQHVWSAGAEYAWRPAQRFELVLGSSLDGIATPRTGDKPARDPQVDFGVTSGARYDLDDAWRLRASAGRKVRFPTMRELFGEALGRFLLNPDLKPESSLLAEAGVGIRHERLSGEVVAFFTRTFDTIDQRSMLLPGENQPRRQRFNLDGSRVFGVEAAGAARPLRGLSVEGHLTWMHARALLDGATRRLAERPEWLGTLTLLHNAPGGFSALLQGVLTGRAYGPDEEDVFRELPASLVVNARLGYRLLRVRRRTLAAEFFARVNNAADVVALPQLGLPGPGREFFFGIDVSF